MVSWFKASFELKKSGFKGFELKGPGFNDRVCVRFRFLVLSLQFSGIGFGFSGLGFRDHLLREDGGPTPWEGHALLLRG